MAEVKGALLIAWVRFLKKRFGEPAVAAAVEALGPAERPALARSLLPASWYS